MSNSLRALLAIGIGVMLVPHGRAAATSDDASQVRDAALAASDLVADEQALLADAEQGDQLSDQLRSVDAAGADQLARLQMLGVEVTLAIETALGKLPEPGNPNAVSLAPPPVVYEAAITDLERIAATPDAVTPGTESGSSSDLLFVAAMSLVVLGGAAAANQVWRRSETTDDGGTGWNDDVTGLASRRRLEVDVADGTRPTAVILVGVDDFDAIVSKYGTDDADNVLRDVATVLAAYVRTDDVVYRYERNAFCILLRNADDVDARTVADRIVRAARRVQLSGGSNITVSLGVAHTEGIGVEEALGTADRAVERARREGCDRAVHADERDVVPV